MTVTIYGLREVDTHELRYIGLTTKPLEERLRKHIRNVKQHYPRKICDWIVAAQKIEIVPLLVCDESDARKQERFFVAKMISEGHRLANSHLVPRPTDAAAAA